MAATIPTLEPLQLNAGDTAHWRKTLPTYPASEGWVLSYTLINAQHKISIGTQPDGDSYRVHVSPAITAAWPAGKYQWRAQVSKDGDIFTVAVGNVAIAPSFDAATLETRSHARITLDNIEAYLQNPNNLKAAAYEIAGRKLTRISIPELVAMRDRYRIEAKREEHAQRIAQGLGSNSRIMMRFGK